MDDDADFRRVRRRSLRLGVAAVAFGLIAAAGIVVGLLMLLASGN